MDSNFGTRSSSTSVQSRGFGRTARFVFWSVVAIVATYVTLLLLLSANGVHLIKGV